MPTLYVMVALPGAGKSTYVNTELLPKGVQLVCPDDLRQAYGHKFYGPIEPFIHTQALMQARALMLRGVDVVIDEATCMYAHVIRWARLADDMGYKTRIIYLATPIELCKERRSRDANFPLEVIDRKDNILSRDFALIKAEFPDLEVVW